MTRLLGAAILTSALAISAMAQKTSNENQVNDRGRERTMDPSQSPNRGRLGQQKSMQSKPITLHGVIVDGSCLDRTAANLGQPPENPSAAAADTATQAGQTSKNGSGVSAHGVTVDARTGEAERSDALEHQVPDLRSRVSDPTCAVTGNTRGLAILLDNGRLLNLDEGGNTLLLTKIENSPGGRAMISGTGPGLKPKATVNGIISGDKLSVTKVLKVE